MVVLHCEIVTLKNCTFFQSLVERERERERERVFDFGKSVPSKYYDKTENPLKDSGEVSAVFECILVVVVRLLSSAETHSE